MEAYSLFCGYLGMGDMNAFNQIERQKYLNRMFIYNLLIGAIVVIGLAFFFAGCSPKDAYWKETKTELRGHCFWWDSVEIQRKGMEKCFIPAPWNPRITCTRQDRHGFRHHCHIFNDCIATWD